MAVLLFVGFERILRDSLALAQLFQQLADFTGAALTEEALAGAARPREAVATAARAAAVARPFFMVFLLSFL